MIIIVNLCYHELHFSEFVQPIIDIIANAGHAFSVIDVSQVYDIANINDADAIILCGTALKDDYFLHNIHDFDWLNDVKIPVFGICAGMQIMALLDGAKSMESQEIGMQKCEIVKSDPLFDALTEVYCLHHLSVGESPNYEIILKSDKNIQAIKHKEKPWYGALFHPEVNNKAVLTRFLENME